MSASGPSGPLVQFSNNILEYTQVLKSISQNLTIFTIVINSCRQIVGL